MKANLHIPRFHQNFLLRLKKRGLTFTTTSSSLRKLQTQRKKSLHFHKQGANNVQSGSAKSSSASAWKILSMPAVALETSTQPKFLEVTYLLNASLDALAVTDHAASCRIRLSEKKAMLQCSLIQKDEDRVRTLIRITSFKQLLTAIERTYGRLCRKNFWYKNRFYRSSTSQKTEVSSSTSKRFPVGSSQPTEAKVKNYKGLIRSIQPRGVWHFVYEIEVNIFRVNATWCKKNQETGK